MSIISDIFTILGKLDTADDIVRVIKEVKEAIEAILNLIDKFKDKEE